MSERRRALVTGGAGFIGSHLVDRLVAEGWRVVVLDDFSSGSEENLAGSRGSIDVVRGDLLDTALLGRALEGAELAFHLAAVPSVARSLAEPVATHEINLTGTLRLLEAARRAGVRRVVYAASCAVYGDTAELPLGEAAPARPLSPYALQKYAGEGYCRLYAEHLGLEAVALRFFNVYGPRQDPASEYSAVIPRFLTDCLKGEAPLVFGDGEQSRDFVFVEDVVRANLLAADAERASGVSVNVASGRSTTLNALLEAIIELTAASVSPRHDAARPGDVRESVADLSRAKELLGYLPEVELREGLVRTFEYLRKHQEGE